MRTEDVLTAIAKELKNNDTREFGRTFIGYYLPEMEVGAGYWATTHFTSSLEVRIQGHTIEKAALSQPSQNGDRQIVGTWIDERPFAGNRITTYRQRGQLYLENSYSDGSTGRAEIEEIESPSGRRFEYQPRRGHGEYFLINDEGQLQQFDTDGPFMTARPVD